MALWTKERLMKTPLVKAVYSGLYYTYPEDGYKDGLTNYSKKLHGEERYIVAVKADGGGNQVGKVNENSDRRQIERPKGWYPDVKKVEAATLHVMLGNLKRVSELTDVPVKDLEKWQDEDWWMATQQRVKRESNHELDSKFTQIVHTAMDKLIDRIENGDEIINFKTGKTERVKITGRDLATIAGVVFDKRQLTRGEATSISVGKTEEHLLKLAEQFVKMKDASQETLLTKDITDQVEVEIVEEESAGTGER